MTKICKTFLIELSVIIFLVSLSDHIEAQDRTDDDIVYISEGWKHSRKKEAEHYKDYVPQITPEYFILGTVNSYMERSYFRLKEDQLDYYWENEDSAAYCLKKYLKDKFRIKIEVEKNEKNRIVINSPELVKKINAYFDENGSLKTDIFRTDEDVFSFLLGVYYRYGYKITDSAYKIQVSNSCYTEIIYSLLNKAGCDKIVYNRKRDLIPVQTIFYFEPSVLLEKYINSIKPEYAVRKVENSKFLSEEKAMVKSFQF